MVPKLFMIDCKEAIQEFVEKLRKTNFLVGQSAFGGFIFKLVAFVVVDIRIFSYFVKGWRPKDHTVAVGAHLSKKTRQANAQ